jgi:hypothetical protein
MTETKLNIIKDFLMGGTVLPGYEPRHRRMVRLPLRDPGLCCCWDWTAPEPLSRRDPGPQVCRHCGLPETAEAKQELRCLRLKALLGKHRPLATLAEAERKIRQGRTL